MIGPGSEDSSDLSLSECPFELGELPPGGPWPPRVASFRDESRLQKHYGQKLQRHLIYSQNVQTRGVTFKEHGAQARGQQGRSPCVNLEARHAD